VEQNNQATWMTIINTNKNNKGERKRRHENLFRSNTYLL